MSLSRKQVETLLKPIHPKRVLRDNKNHRRLTAVASESDAPEWTIR